MIAWHCCALRYASELEICLRAWKDKFFQGVEPCKQEVVWHSRIYPSSHWAEGLRIFLHAYVHNPAHDPLSRPKYSRFLHRGELDCTGFAKSELTTRGMTWEMKPTCILHIKWEDYMKSQAVRIIQGWLPHVLIRTGHVPMALKCEGGSRDSERNTLETPFLLAEKKPILMASSEASSCSEPAPAMASSVRSSWQDRVWDC